MEIITTGDMRVLDAFYDPTRKLALAGCAGGNRGAFNVGLLGYLKRRRLLYVPQAAIGVSSAVATLAYFFGNGKISDGKVFSNDMSDKRMFSLARRLSGKRAFDVAYVERVFRGIETNRGIDAEEVCRHPAPLYGVMADAKTGEPIIERLTTPERVWQVSSYATAVSGFAKPSEYEGRLVTDAYFSSAQIPVQALLDREPQVTDVLLFASQHYETLPKFTNRAEMLLHHTGYAPVSKAVREQIRTRHIRFMEEVHRIMDPANVGGVRVLVIWIPQKLHPIFIDEAQSRELIRMGYHSMKYLFSERGL